MTFGQYLELMQAIQAQQSPPVPSQSAPPVIPPVTQPTVPVGIPTASFPSTLYEGESGTLSVVGACPAGADGWGVTAPNSGGGGGLPASRVIPTQKIPLFLVGPGQHTVTVKCEGPGRDNIIWRQDINFTMLPARTESITCNSTTGLFTYGNTRVGIAGPTELTMAFNDCITSGGQRLTGAGDVRGDWNHTPATFATPNAHIMGYPCLEVRWSDGTHTSMWMSMSVGVDGTPTLLYTRGAGRSNTGYRMTSLTFQTAGSPMTSSSFRLDDPLTFGAE